MALVAVKQWGNTTTEQNSSLTLGGAMERRRGWGGTCGDDSCLLFGAANGTTTKIEIEDNV